MPLASGRVGVIPRPELHVVEGHGLGGRDVHRPAVARRRASFEGHLLAVGTSTTKSDSAAIGSNCDGQSTTISTGTRHLAGIELRVGDGQLYCEQYQQLGGWYRALVRCVQ